MTSHCLEYRHPDTGRAAHLWLNTDHFWYLYIDAYYPGKGGNYIPSNGPTIVKKTATEMRQELRTRGFKR